MLRRIFQFLFAMLLAIATYFLTYQSLKVQTHGRTQAEIVVSGIVIGIAASVQFISVSTRFLGLKRGTDKNIDAALWGQLVDFFKTKAFGKDIMDVSLHVWIVPIWYRRLFPYSFRLRIRKVTRKLPSFDSGGGHFRLRPTLRRIGYEQFASRSRSNVDFRKGYGLIGHCLMIAEGDGEKTRISYAEVRGNFSALVGQGKEAWNEDNSIDKWGLEFEDAQKLSSKYGQVLAIPLRASSDEAVGCVTLSVPGSCTTNLFLSASVRKGLTTTQEIVEQLLRQGGDYAN